MINRKNPDVPLCVVANLDDITPLELATLAIGLRQAGFISQCDDREFLGTTLKFLDVSADVLNIRREADAYKKLEDEFEEEVFSLSGQAKSPTPSPYLTPHERELEAEAAIETLWAGLDDPKRVSVVEIMKRLGKVNLTAEELAIIGENVEWHTLKVEKQLECAFLFLTREPVTMNACNPVPSKGKWFEGKVELEVKMRDELIRDGVPAWYIRTLWQFLKVAHEQRKQRQRVGAPKKRKPHPPKGGDGKFQKKARGVKGEYERQQETAVPKKD